MSAADHLGALLEALDAQKARLQDQRRAIEGVDTLIRATEDRFPIDLAVTGTDIALTLRLGPIGVDLPTSATFSTPVTPQVFDDPIWPRAEVAHQAPARRPEPPQSQPATETPKAGVVTGPFTEAENATILEMFTAGATKSEIAAALNRKSAALALQIPRVVKAAKAKRPQRDQKPVAVPRRTPPKPAPEPVPAPKPDPVATATPPSRPDDLPPLGAFASAEARARRAAQERLDWVCRTQWRDSSWTPARDLALVEALVNGEGLAGAAEALGIGKDDAKARWKALMPEVTLEAQAAMLAVLRERIGPREAAE